MRGRALIVLLAATGCPDEGGDAPSPEPPPVTERPWSFAPIQRRAPPELRFEGAARNAIDRFVLEDAEEAPCGDVAPYVLMRRVHLDLTGLPPAPETVDAFARDPSDEAYAAIVDELIASPAYAEHFAREWLDIARYADSHGYSFDMRRDTWVWRDWVIDAIDRKVPFDRFTYAQLAGDLDGSDVLATGFLRNHPITREGGVIDEEFRVEYAADRVRTLGVAWLGLTLECARCHDHKYDPIAQRDFYALFACFDGWHETGNGAESDYIPRAEVTSPLADRTGLSLDDRIGTPARALVAANDRPDRVTNVRLRGRYDAHGDAVRCAPPAAVPPSVDGAFDSRADLARWLVSADHPLTPRVVANRAWQHFFGEGLVKTPEDFGHRGDRPSNPSLLDHLAATLVDGGWDRAALHRHIVLSSTYRSCGVAPVRLDAEVIRDQALAASGLLVRTVGGPPVFPYQPPGLWLEQNDREPFAEAYVEDRGHRLYRRSIYTFWKRSVPPPAMTVYDAPNREVAVAARGRTVTSLQALASLNDPQMVEAGRHLAARMLDAGIEDGFSRVLVRPPTEAETERLDTLFVEQKQIFEADPGAAERLLAVGDSPRDGAYAPVDHAAMMQVARAILNLSETVVRP